MLTLEVRGALATLNDHDAANRSQRYYGAALKKTMTEHVRSQLENVGKHHGPIENPVVISFNWYVSGKHDYDNIRFAAKYVLDGMVKAGVLVDDSPKWVYGFGGDRFTRVAKGHEGVTIEIEEVNVREKVEA